MNASKIRIHVVDDGKFEREVMTEILQSAGYEVTCSEDSREALESIIRNPPDLLVTDYHMPGMNGYELLREIRNNKDLRSLLVIALTADENEDTKIKLLEAGANDFLRKGVSRQEILVRIRAHLSASEALKQKALLELAGACAHELNNPLAVLLSATELLAEKIQELPNIHDKKPFIRLMSTIRESVAKSAKLVDQLKDIRGYSTSAYYSKIRITDLRASLGSGEPADPKQGG